MPRARNAIVGLPPCASSASSRCATISASADSDVPHVFSERDTIAACLARPAQQVGDDVLGDHLLHLVRNAGHRVDDLAVRRARRAARARYRSGSGSPRRPRARRPGAGCSAACRARAARNIAAIVSARSSWRTSGTPMSSAIASRVRSSCVGPSPPHTSTASERASRSRSAATMRGLVVADRAVLVGVDARRRELLADPRTVRVDDLAEQQLGTDRENLASHLADSRRLRFRRAASRCSRGARSASPDTTVSATATPSTICWKPTVVGGPRQQHEADRAVLRERLVLAEPLRRQHDARAGPRPSGTRDAELARRRRAAPATTGTRRGRRAPRTRRARCSLSATGSRNAPRAGRAVAPREPAVEAVARGDREPQRDRQPLEPSRGSARASGSRPAMRAQREEVRGRRERALAEALRARGVSAVGHAPAARHGRTTFGVEIGAFARRTPSRARSRPGGRTSSPARRAARRRRSRAPRDACGRRSRRRRRRRRRARRSLARRARRAPRP